MSSEKGPPGDSETKPADRTKGTAGGVRERAPSLPQLRGTQVGGFYDMLPWFAPVAVLVGDKDKLVKKLYLEHLQKVRKDWPVIEIKDAGHLSCIAKTSFQEEIVKWLAKHPRKAEG
jgi:hypothetical protein